jgi:hypothetical protein
MDERKQKISALVDVEETADGLRIIFHPRRSFWKLIIPVVGFPAIVVALQLTLFRFSGERDRLFYSIFCGLYFGIFMVRNYLHLYQRYTISISDNDFRIAREFLGMKWGRSYPLTVIGNFRFRYHPIFRSPDNQELIFDRYSCAINGPIRVNSIEADRIKEAVYSRFPQLIPDPRTYSQALEEPAV